MYENRKTEKTETRKKWKRKENRETIKTVKSGYMAKLFFLYVNFCQPYEHCALHVFGTDSLEISDKLNIHSLLPINDVVLLIAVKNKQ